MMPESVGEFAGTLRTATLERRCLLTMIHAIGGLYDYRVEVPGDGSVPSDFLPGATNLAVTLHMDCGCIFTAELVPHTLSVSRGKTWAAMLVAGSPLNDTPTRCRHDNCDYHV